MAFQLCPIPDKLYFSIGEAAELCGVKPHVLRFWEEQFSELRPGKRRGSKQRCYRKQEIELIRVIRGLLHDEGYTIKGAQQRLKELAALKRQGNLLVDRAALREMRQDLEAVIEMLDRAGSNIRSPAL